MRTIAVMNQKGGVGKTTTSVNLSSALAARGKKVMLIDLDPQAHASLHLGLTFEKEFPSVYDVLINNETLANVRKEAAENLWLVPAHLDLAAADFELASVVGRELILRDKIANDSMEFDYIVVDCPRSLHLLTINALAAVEEVIIPLQQHFLALHSLSKLHARKRGATSKCSKRISGATCGSPKRRAMENRSSTTIRNRTARKIILPLPKKLCV